MSWCNFKTKLQSIYQCWTKIIKYKEFNLLCFLIKNSTCYVLLQLLPLCAKWEWLKFMRRDWSIVIQVYKIIINIANKAKQGHWPKCNATQRKRWLLAKQSQYTQWIRPSVHLILFFINCQSYPICSGPWPWPLADENPTVQTHGPSIMMLITTTSTFCASRILLFSLTVLQLTRRKFMILLVQIINLKSNIKVRPDWIYRHT